MNTILELFYSGDVAHLAVIVLVSVIVWVVWALRYNRE